MFCQQTFYIFWKILADHIFFSALSILPTSYCLRWLMNLTSAVSGCIWECILACKRLNQMCYARYELTLLAETHVDFLRSFSPYYLFVSFLTKLYCNIKKSNSVEAPRFAHIDCKKVFTAIRCLIVQTE